MTSEIAIIEEAVETVEAEEVETVEGEIVEGADLVPVERPKVRENVQPWTQRSQKLRASEKYERIIAANRQLGGRWIIAWIREGYAMLKTGTKGEWATVCTHGTLVKVTKGAEAELAGKVRANWCPRCREV